MKAKMCWYMLTMRKNHLSWWIEDNAAERLHLALDWLDEAYWRAFMRIGSF